MNWTTLGAILASVACSAIAQIALKRGMAGGWPEGGAASVALAIAGNPWVLGGLGLYFLGAVVWLAVLSKLPVSVAYPFVSLGFIATMLLGWWFFAEPITAQKLAGTLLVACGVVLVASARAA